MSQFKIGDSVQLKAGTQKMTVVGLPKGSDGEVSVNCAWHDKDGKEHTSNYPSDALKMVTKRSAISGVAGSGQKEGGGTGWMGR